MSNNTLVSIILSTYNRASYLKKSVDSVLKQTYKNFELIIVHDVSGDNTAEIVAELMARDNRIKLIVNKNNLGLVKSANRGVSAARGQYIARIDDDDEWRDPQKLEKQIAFLEKNPEYVLIGSGVIRINEKGKEIIRHILPEHDVDIRKVILKDSPFAQSAVVFRRDAWERVGGYDEGLNFAEDWDLWLRMGKVGKMYNIQEYLINYLQGSQNISNKKIRRNAILNLKIRWKYRSEYPGIYKALILGLAYLIYTLLPPQSPRLKHNLNRMRQFFLGEPVFKAQYGESRNNYIDSLVSVIIPTFNRKNFVEQAINSVLLQTYKNIEVIVVDDSSSDGTEKTISKLSDIKVRVIRHKINKGVSAACNTGIRAAKGEFLFILNDDDFLLPNAIEKLVKQFQHSSVRNLGAVYGWSLWIDEKGKPVKITSSTMRGDLFRNILKGHIFTNLLLKKKVFTEVGFYKEELKSNEDFDFYLRLAKHYQFDFTPEVVVVIQNHSNSHLSSFSKEHVDTHMRIKSEYGARKNVLKSFARNTLPPWLYIFYSRIKSKASMRFFLLRNPGLISDIKRMRLAINSEISNRMNIAWIEISEKKYGGVLYNKEAQAALSKEFNVESVVKEAKWFSGARYLKISESILRIMFLKGEKDVWVRDFYSTLTMPFDRTKGKNIVVIHHDDFSGFSLMPRIILTFFQKTLFYWALKKADAIVTVSEYWREHFLRKGYKNIHLIYNGFDIVQFNISDKEVENFKKRYRLEGKPIIYLGNCQRAKGVVEAHEQLKGLDAYLVTSGSKQVDIPAINLELEYRDYICLLKASSVVLTMSKFKEGWCRTAHEAMLLGTPVIGSGKGGMRELLEGGGQIVCPRSDILRHKVETLLSDARARERLGKNGRKFAEQFSLERFEEEWIKFLWRFKN